MTLESVRAEFAMRLGHLGPVVLAGGSVRDHLLGREPKDYDVFVLGACDESRQAAVAAGLYDLEVINPPEYHNSEPYLVRTVRLESAVIQVMCSPVADVLALLDTFDWNVCAFAYDGNVTAREDVANIAPGRELRLLRVTFPQSTLRRGFRFSERFEMVLRDHDVLKLCAIVLARGAGVHLQPVEPVS